MQSTVVQHGMKTDESKAASTANTTAQQHTQPQHSPDYSTSFMQQPKNEHPYKSENPFAANVGPD